MMSLAAEIFTPKKERIRRNILSARFCSHILRFESIDLQVREEEEHLEQE